MFSATVWDPILFIFAVYNFRHYDDKLLNILISWMIYFLNICEPNDLGLSVEILVNTTTQRDGSYKKHIDEFYCCVT
jgi:hypothetical protein